MIPITLQLDWKPNAQFAGILLAHRLGLYQQAGINLVIVPGPLPADPLNALNTSENVIVCADDNLIIQARAAGQPVKAIAAMLQYSALGWMALKSSGIRQMSDLRHKKLGIHLDGMIALDVALTHFGMTRADIQIVPLAFDYAQALRHRHCEAIQGFVITEPIELAEIGLPVEAMPAYEWSYQAYAQVLATTDHLIAAQPEALSSFLEVTFAGWRHALAHPTEAINIITTYYLPDTQPKVEGQILEAIRPFLLGHIGLDRLGWMERERWEQSIRYLVDYKIINKRLPAEEVMTNYFIEAIYKH